MAALLLALVPAVAAAHNMPTSAVLLDIEAHQVAGEVQLPLGRLAVALQRPVPVAQATGSQLASIRRYVQQHVRAVGTDGRVWKTRISGGHIKRVPNANDLVLDLRLVPPARKVTDFDLRYDAIIERLVTHRAIATIRSQFNKGTTLRDPETLGVFTWNHKSVHVDGDGGSWLRGFTSMAGLGVQHISEGADHLLFLLMLLIPAPLLVSGGRWRRRDDARKSVLRVTHVVTAFAIGHSMTLALGALGVVDVPSRLVESLIALSILISAVHALRPLVPGGEALIAGGFGLVHGLAFATVLGGMGLHGGALVSSLLGFNLGIELTQLLVVALMMPSLYVLSRTSVYAVLRPAAALVGVVFSGAWLLERTTLTGHDPFAGVTGAVVDHPFALPAVFASAALIAYYLPIARPTPGVSTE